MQELLALGRRGGRAGQRERGWRALPAHQLLELVEDPLAGLHRGPAAGGHAAPPRLHLGRLAILVLVLIGASFYVSPLRDFFVQQDRYQKEAATLQAARAGYENGKVDFSTLIEAQRQILRTRLSLLDAEVETALGVVEVERLTGAKL